MSKKKHCFCGDPVPTGLGKGAMKYCQFHSAMPVHLRDAEKKRYADKKADELAELLAGEKEKNLKKQDCDMPKNIQEAEKSSDYKAYDLQDIPPYAPVSKSERNVAKIDSKTEVEGVDFKFCGWKPCGKKFYRTEENEGTWGIKKYCCPTCSSNAQSKRSNDRKKKERIKFKEMKQAFLDGKPVVRFGKDRAAEIAREVLSDWDDVLATTFRSAIDLDQFKALAGKMLVEAQMEAFREVA